jgi:hypothetical protein
MIVFESVIIVIGFIISIIILTTKNIEGNNKFKKYLAGLYILVCIASVSLLISKSINNKNSSLKLFQELSEIGIAVEIQKDSIQLILRKTALLYNKLDSINKNTEHIIKQREISQKVFEEQNKILEKTNELTQKRMNAEKPEVIVYGNQISFKSIDSSKSECQIIFYNNGKRTASRFSNITFFAFKNKDGIYFHHKKTEDPPTKNESIIPAYSEKKTISQIDLSFDQVKNLTSGGTIIIYYKYYDELLNIYEPKECRFEFSNNWHGNNILKNENLLEEKGLIEYLRKIKSP